MFSKNSIAVPILLIIATICLKEIAGNDTNRLRQSYARGVDGNELQRKIVKMADDTKKVYTIHEEPTYGAAQKGESDGNVQKYLHNLSQRPESSESVRQHVNILWTSTSTDGRSSRG